MKAVVCYIENQNGEFLLLLRNFPPFGWCLPGGKVEDDEVAIETAIREVKEETNIDIELPIRMGDAQTLKLVDVAIFKSSVGAPSVTTSDEHSNYMWVYNTEGIELAGVTQDFINIAKS